jgi:hypothetical protein
MMVIAANSIIEASNLRSAAISSNSDKNAFHAAPTHCSA